MNHNPIIQRTRARQIARRRAVVSYVLLILGALLSIAGGAVGAFLNSRGLMALGMLIPLAVGFGLGLFCYPRMER